MSNTNGNRAQYAAEQYIKYVTGWGSTDYPSGYRARKIDQAYRVYLYYAGISPVHPSIYKRSKI